MESGCHGENAIANADGPQTFSLDRLLCLLALAVGARVRLVHVPASSGFDLTRLVGFLLRDVVLTRDEFDGLMTGLLTSDGTPMSTTTLAD